MKILEIVESVLIESKSALSAKQIEALIRKYAKKVGIDPDVAVLVWRSEGGTTYQSTVKPKKGSKVKTVNGREASWGPFQLYTGGGLGSAYEEKYGVKLADENTPEGIERQIEFALTYAATSGRGWKDWYGPGNMYTDWDPYKGIPGKDDEVKIDKEVERRLLRLGIEGDDVEELQKKLNTAGYNIAVDGIFGKETLKALKDFQKNQGLTADGIVGDNTYEVLDNITIRDTGNTDGDIVKPQTRPETKPDTKTEPDTFTDMSDYYAWIRAGKPSVWPPVVEPKEFPGISPETKDEIEKTVKDVVTKSTIDKSTGDELNKMVGEPKNAVQKKPKGTTTKSPKVMTTAPKAPSYSAGST